MDINWNQQRQIFVGKETGEYYIRTVINGEVYYQSPFDYIHGGYADTLSTLIESLDYVGTFTNRQIRCLMNVAIYGDDDPNG